MNKGTTMNSGRSVFGWLTCFARVRFLGVITVFGALAVPAFAAPDSEPALTDLPGPQPAQRVVDPAQPIDESIPTQTVETHFCRIFKSVVEAAQALAPAVDPDAQQALNEQDPDAAPAKQAPSAPSAPSTPSATSGEGPAAQAAQADGQDDELKAREAEIDTIAAQIEQERIDSAKRIADLENQLNEARQQLAAITATDSEGFIRNWLVLGPIHVDEKVSNHDEESNKDLLDRQYMPAASTPTDGDKLTVDETELTWTATKSPDYFVDLAKLAFDQELDGEHAAYLGVAYITSEEEVTGVKLCIGSDDDSVWRLNGKEVIRSYTGRGVDKDQDSADDLTLKQGVNVLTFTVLNGEGPSSAAARFVDEDGNPVRGLKVSLTPPTPQVTKTDINPEGGE
jgi:hypothetical protein